MGQMQKVDVLSIEDESDTMVGTVSELEAEGVSVDSVQTIDEARAKLKSNDYAVLLVDLRLPAKLDGELEEKGGLKIIHDLRKGALGKKNKGKRYFIITAQSFLLDRLSGFRGRQSKEERNALDGCINVFGKGSSIFPLVAQIRAAIEQERGAAEGG